MSNRKMIKGMQKRETVRLENCSKRLLSKDYILIDTDLLALRCIWPGLELDDGILYYYKKYEYNAYKIYRNEHFVKEAYKDPELFVNYMFEFSKVMNVSNFVYVSENNEYYYYDVANEECVKLGSKEFVIDDTSSKEVGHISILVLGCYLSSNLELNEFLKKPVVSVIGGEGEIFSLNK